MATDHPLWTHEADERNPLCRLAREEWLLGEDGDRPLSEAVREHVAVCPACRDEVAGLARISAALRAALAPQPVQPEVLRAIQRRAAAGVARPARVLRLRPALGAAAALLLAVFGPRLPAPPAPVAEFALSHADAEAIVAAYAALDWEDPLAPSVEELDAWIASVAGSVERLSQEAPVEPAGRDG